MGKPTKAPAFTAVEEDEDIVLETDGDVMDDEDESEFDLEAVTARAVAAFSTNIQKQIEKTNAAKVVDKLVTTNEDTEKKALGKMLSREVAVNEAPKPTISHSQRAKLKTSSAGPGWFNLPETRITPEIKRDLHVLNLRSAIDRKQKYKKGSQKVKTMPKYFQIGTVVAGPTDYHSRLTKKEGNMSLAEQLLASSDQRKYRKNKYLDLQTKNRAGYKPRINKKKNNKGGKGGKGGKGRK